MIVTPGSGHPFGSLEDAWYSALGEMVGLGKQYYPDAFKTYSFIPELGVEIVERRGQFYYDGIIVGAQEEGKRFGFVSFDFTGDPDVVARGHMHWINITGSADDVGIARDFYNFRVQSGRPTYDEFVGDWNKNWSGFFHNGALF
jgi:hypothetical protein